MTNLAMKKIFRSEQPSIKLVDHMEIKDKEDRKWFREFLNSIFSSPDMDYSQYEHLEMKRTPQQMRRNGLY